MLYNEPYKLKDKREKMNHYTYEITFENNMKYIGVRSCKCPINEDPYTGSSKIIPPELYATCEKKILKIFNTRIEAVEHEINLHNELDIVVNKQYYNQAKQTSTFFDQSGARAETHASVAAMANKLSGRTKKEYQYLKEKAANSRRLRGENRTEAQKKADLALSKYRGIKNPDKGNSGIDNPNFKPWYYINPDGLYIEILDMPIRQYCSQKDSLLSVNPSSIYIRISTEPHNPILKGKLKGYVFGYLHNKPNYITQENINIAYNIFDHIIIPYVHGSKTKNKRNLISNITGKK